MSSITLAPYVATRDRVERPARLRTSTTSSTANPDTASPQGPRRRGPRKPPSVAALLASLGRATASAMLVVGVVAFLALAVGPHLLGYQTATMLTGSMSPTIDPGDVVVASPVPVSSVHKGDVISYHIPVEDHRVETHRIVDVIRTDGQTTVRTKGDANDGVDPWTANLQGETVWKVRAVVPDAGTAIRLLRAPMIQGFVFWGAIIALVAGVLARIWRNPSEPDDPTTTSPAAPVRTRAHVR